MNLLAQTQYECSCNRDVLRNGSACVRLNVSDPFPVLVADFLFCGFLPALVVAFGSRKKLSQDEIDELQKVIDSMRG